MRRTPLDAASRANLRTVSRTALTAGIAVLGDGSAQQPPIVDHWVYFIRSGDAVKIGHARDPYTRLMNIRTASPADVVYLGHVAGALDEERALHERFRHLRLRGEWFRAEPELLAFIAEHRFDADA